MPSEHALGVYAPLFLYSCALAPLLFFLLAELSDVDRTFSLDHSVLLKRTPLLDESTRVTEGVGTTPY
jgi:hypothetical protein